TCRAHAAAEHVRADDVKAVGIDGLAGADDVFPPARFAGNRVTARDILVGGQRMANQDRVRLCRIELAVSLVGYRERSQILLACQPQRRARVEMYDRARRRMNLRLSPRDRNKYIRGCGGHRVGRCSEVKRLDRKTWRLVRPALDKVTLNF